MNKLLPLVVCVCGIICVIGSIGGIVWEFPKFVYLLMAVGHLTLASVTLYRFYQVNKTNRD